MSIDKIKSSENLVLDELLQLVSFNIGDEEFGVDILKVQEINRMVQVTRVPNTPDYVLGVINLRGKVIPIIDMRNRLGMATKEFDKDTRIVIVEIESKVIGFVVDAVSEVIRINKSITEPPPPMVAGIDSEYITAIGKLEDRLLILLDLRKILTDEDHKSLGDLDNID
jgi:purine-binding chemotaxis protein CheW